MTRKLYAVTDKDGSRWLIDACDYPYRTGEGTWGVIDKYLFSFDYVPDCGPIYKEMFYFYAGHQTWDDEPIEIPSIRQFMKDIWTKEDENGNKFKYVVLKIEDLADSLSTEENICEFFEITDAYNEHRAKVKGKAPNKYWVINRDEVPEIKTFEEFKNKLKNEQRTLDCKG